MIGAAFASKNHNDVYCLRRLMVEMIERSPQRKKKSGYASSVSSSVYDSDGQSIRSAFSRQSNRSATTVITVKSAPAAYKNNAISQQVYGNSIQDTSLFTDKARRAKSVEPQKRKGRRRFGKQEKIDQSADAWFMDPDRFVVKSTDVDYAL